MPYFKIQDLPDNVRHVLPKLAQEIYRKEYIKKGHRWVRKKER